MDTFLDNIPNHIALGDIAPQMDAHGLLAVEQRVRDAAPPPAAVPFTLAQNVDQLQPDMRVILLGIGSGLWLALALPT